MLKKLAFAGLGIALLATPLLTSADTLSDLQAQIQALMAQLNALQAQANQTTPNTSTPPSQPDDYGTGTTTTGVYCPKLSITMQRGARDATTGGQVSELQTFLTDYYNLDENIVVGGYFGKLTESYVIKFQKEQGLPAFGIAGTLTRAKIAETCGGGSMSRKTPTIILAANPPLVRPGQDTMVTWSTQNATRCWLQHGATNGTDFEETVAPNGTKQFNPYVRYHVKVGCANEPGDGRDGPQSSQDVIINIIPPFQENITVTAPNGGEQWEIGQLNTITWAPYSYTPYTPTNVNPASDVNVFLERLDGSTAGQIMDTGKASLHTYFNIGGYDSWAEPGQYRVYVANRVTGATDRSDAPFTLLPRGVDIKVNGSDGPVTLTDNQRVTVSIKTGANFTNCTLNGIRANPGGSPSISLGQAVAGGSSTSEGYAYAPTPGSSTAIYIICTKADGSTRSDSVQVNIGGVAASLQVTSPNGAEQFFSDKTNAIKWKNQGVSSVSIALYRNDQWQYWIKKDIPVSNNPESSFSYIWNPSSANLGALSDLGQVFKIYITGQRTDGQGYVDDKSDAPFSFTGGTPPTPGPTCSISASPASVGLFQPFALTWTSTGGTSASITTNGLASTKTAVELNGNFPSSNQGYSGTFTYLLTVTGVTGTGTCSTSINVSASTMSISADKPAYLPGEPVRVSWSNLGTTYTKDWIALVSAGGMCDSTTECSTSVRWFYTSGAASGSKTVTAPSTPGSYEFVYFVNDGRTELARTAAFTVAAPTASITNANLANALTALESALKALLAILGQ